MSSSLNEVSQCLRRYPHRRQLARFYCLFLATFIVNIAQAEITTDFNGFGTISGAHLDDDSINVVNGGAHNNFEQGTSYDIDSKFALQGSVNFNDRVRLTAQAVALGRNNYAPEVEWGYLNWHINDDLDLRIGHLRRPNYLYSDSLRVGYTYHWIRPPVEVYSPDLQLFSEFDGIEATYTGAVRDWSYELETYFGGSTDRDEVIKGESVKITTRDAFGITLSLEKKWLKLRMGYQHSPEVYIETRSDIEPLFDAVAAVGFADVAAEMEIEDVKLEYYNLATDINYQNWFLGIEYIEAHFAESLAPDAHARILTVGRRLGAWTLHYTYGVRKQKNSRNFTQSLTDQADAITPINPVIGGTLNALAAGIEQAQDLIELDLKSHTIGIRFDFNTPMALKAEFQKIHDNRNDLNNELFSIALDFFF